MYMNLPQRTLMALAITLVLAACAPRTDESSRIPLTPTPPRSAPQTPPGTPDLSDPDIKAVDGAAKEAFRLMGQSYERGGSYDVSSLASGLKLPPGVRWQLENLSNIDYVLRFTSDTVPDLAWLVTPEGVKIEDVATNRIL